MQMLVGYTGFVGSNLLCSHEFETLYNSKNISGAFGRFPELLVYSGVKAEKFLANSEPENDFMHVSEAIRNIEKIAPSKVVLISTVDVFGKTYDVDESSLIDELALNPYGKNRLFLEHWIETQFADRLIVRLPGLYGKNLKKNFIYDLMNKIPSMLTHDKFVELSVENAGIASFYELQSNKFYKCKSLSIEERKLLRSFFGKSRFNALNFTDSRAKFQFYNLAWLWEHIETALNCGIKLLTLATEPIHAEELFKVLTGEVFQNELPNPIPNYDVKSLHASSFGGKNGYIKDKKSVMSDIYDFVRGELV